MSDPAEDGAVTVENGQIRYSLKDVQRNRKRIKRSLAQNSFFSYILFDFWKIRKYGRDTGLIESAPLFRLKVAAGIGERLERSLKQDVVIPLAARLDVILQKAWLHLNKEEYNLIALLRSVCLESERLALLRMNSGSRYIHEMFRNLEPQLLLFYYRPQLVKRLLEILSHAHDSMESVRFSFRETRMLIERLILFDAMRPSLSQTVLAVNMVNSRRFLSMNDLIDAPEEPLISRLEYDVDDKLHREIYRYLDDLDKKLAALHSTFVQMNGQRHFMPRLDAQTPDLTMLQRFITGKTGPERKGIYSELYTNIPSYVLDFSNTWIRSFETLICRQPLVEQHGAVSLFSPSLFSDYFSKLKFNLDQIERMRTQLPFFQILRYLELTKKSRRPGGYGEAASKLETRLLALLDDHIQLFRALKEELHRLCVVFSYPEERWESETIGGEDMRKLPRGNQMIIKLADRKLLSDGFINGMSVREAMTASVSLLNLYLYELQEGNVLSELEDDAKIRSTIRNLLQVAGRLGNAEQRRRFEKKYPIDRD
jgi:hypothetical protein